MEKWQYLVLGLVDFKQFLFFQHELWEKRAGFEIPNTILFAEHPPTISLGARADEAQLWHLTVTKEELEERGIPIVKTKRGGSITVHGPGVLGCYVIAYLGQKGYPVNIVPKIEEWAMCTLDEIGIGAANLPRDMRNDTTDLAKYEGLWIKNKKVASVGIRISRKVSQFGINININPEEWLLKLAHPCGIREYEMTSLEKEGIHVHRRKVIDRLAENANKFLN